MDAPRCCQQERGYCACAGLHRGRPRIAPSPHTGRALFPSHTARLTASLQPYTRVVDISVVKRQIFAFLTPLKRPAPCNCHTLFAGSNVDFSSSHDGGRPCPSRLAKEAV